MAANKKERHHIHSQTSNDSSSLENSALMFSNISDQGARSAEVSLQQNGEVVPLWMRSAPFRKLRHPADSSLLWTIIMTFIYLVAAIIICCPILAFIVVALPIGLIVRHLLASCCCCSPERTCACHCASMLTPADAFWLHDSEFNRSIMQTLIILEKGLDLARVRDIINCRLIMAEGEDGKKLFPRFTQRVQELKCGQAWVEDDTFNIDNHVFAMPPSVKTRADLERYLGQLASKEISLSHPLWEVHVAFECGDQLDTAIILRVHQTISDGVGLCRNFCRYVMDQHVLDCVKTRSGNGAVFFNGIRALLVGPIYVLSNLLFASQDLNYFSRKPLTGRKKVVWSDPIHMAQLVRIKSVSRSTLNDVLMSVIAGCFRNYLQEKRVVHPYDIRTLIPIDFRLDDNTTGLGTEFSLVPMVLPSNVEGLIPRLWKVKRTMDNLKNSADSVAIYGLIHVLNYIFPASFLHLLVSHLFNKSSVIVSNVPGPVCNLSLASYEVKAIITWFPTRDNISLSVSLMSYDDQLRVALLADEALIHDPELLLKYFHTSVNFAIFTFNLMNSLY